MPERRATLVKAIVFSGHSCVLVCDGRCDKAWGINGRPRRMLSKADDDYVYLPDSALGDAPPPGQTVTIAEGADIKPSAGPLRDTSLMNRWCARECERATMHPAEERETAVPRDLEHPRPNIPRGITGGTA